MLNANASGKKPKDILSALECTLLITELNNLLYVDEPLTPDGVRRLQTLLDEYNYLRLAYNHATLQTRCHPTIRSAAKAQTKMDFPTT